MRIGVYGGTFNPIHFGHLRAAEEIRERFRMPEVIFVPSFIPPHKDAGDIVDPAHRLAMVNLALEGADGFSVSEVEISRRGKSYSIDTVIELKAARPEGEVTFIMGLDAFLEIETWHKYREIFGECDFIVTTRPGSDATSWADAVPATSEDAFKRTAEEEVFEHISGKKLIFTKVSSLDISATSIRKAIKSGASARFLLPESTRRYIDEHGLYK